jgi:hypothetical protein
LQLGHFLVGDVLQPFRFATQELTEARRWHAREGGRLLRQPGGTARQGAHGGAEQDGRDPVSSRPVGRDSVRKLVRAGEMTYRQAGKAVADARQNPLLVKFRSLSPEEAQQVYDLGTPEEQKLWERAMRLKGRRLRRKASSP